MSYLTSKKGQESILSEHFKSTEFDCHGKGCCTETRVNKALLDYIEKIRVHFDKPITISSGYRCPVHNRSVGGATKSKHASGDAADIIVKDVSPRDVARYAESIGINGVGLYETSKDGHFVHIDIRPTKAFWYGQAQEKRTTFGGTQTVVVEPEKKPNKDTANVSTLRLGDKGDLVKDLQKMLMMLDYSCGGGAPDGAYGTMTMKSVRKFQQDNGLAADGIAGRITQEALRSAVAAFPTSGDTISVNANLLNVRSGADTKHKVVGTTRKGETHKLIEVSGYWGRIANPNGWVSLQYCKKQ